MYWLLKTKYLPFLLHFQAAWVLRFVSWMAHLGIVYSLILQCSLYMLIVIYARIAKFI